MRLFYVVFILFFHFAQAQKDSIYLRGNNTITLSPLLVISPVFPSFEMRYERIFNQKYSLGASIGYFLPEGLIFLGLSSKNISGFTLAIEPKLYFKRHRRLAQFTSFYTKYSLRNYENNLGFRSENSLESPMQYEIQHDDVEIRKRTTSFSIRYGVQFFFSFFTLELGTGAGIMYRSVKYRGKDIEGELLRSRHPNVYNIINKEGNYWVLTIPVNIRIGYVF